MIWIRRGGGGAIANAQRVYFQRQKKFAASFHSRTGQHGTKKNKWISDVSPGISREGRYFGTTGGLDNTKSIMGPARFSRRLLVRCLSTTNNNCSPPSNTESENTNADRGRENEINLNKNEFDINEALFLSQIEEKLDPSDQDPRKQLEGEESSFDMSVNEALFLSQVDASFAPFEAPQEESIDKEDKTDNVTPIHVGETITSTTLSTDITGARNKPDATIDNIIRRPAPYGSFTKGVSFVPITKEMSDTDNKEQPAVAAVVSQHFRPRASNPSSFVVPIPPPLIRPKAQRSPTTSRRPSNNKKTTREKRKPASTTTTNNNSHNVDRFTQLPSAGPLWNHLETQQSLEQQQQSSVITADSSETPEMRHSRHAPAPRRQQQQAPLQPLNFNLGPKTIAHLLQASGEQKVPMSPYIIIDHIPKVTSLETMVQGINAALDRAVLHRGGIVNIDAVWDEEEAAGAVGEEGEAAVKLPLLDLPSMFPQYANVFQEGLHGVVASEMSADASSNDDGKDEDDARTFKYPEPPSDSKSVTDDKDDALVFFPQNDLYRWVHEARLILSAHGRPAGWRMKLANRSIAYALLNGSKQDNVFCAWKIVPINEWTQQAEDKITLNYPDHKNNNHKEPRVRVCFSKTSENESINSLTPIGNNQSFYDEDLDMDTLDWLDDSVLRVENCDEGVNEQDLLHIFSRFDLKTPSILRWTGVNTANFTMKTSPIYFVRFADASWARAALREKQSHVACGQPLCLVQFPKQFFPKKASSHHAPPPNDDAKVDDGQEVQEPSASMNMMTG